MAVKKIVVARCTECPNIDHKGGFGSPAYIPVCRANGTKGKTTLPYTESSHLGRSTASPTGVIPDWCPLEDE
jgi:hypothetical protein